MATKTIIGARSHSFLGEGGFSWSETRNSLGSQETESQIVPVSAERTGLLYYNINRNVLRFDLDTFNPDLYVYTAVRLKIYLLQIFTFDMIHAVSGELVQPIITAATYGELAHITAIPLPGSGYECRFTLLGSVWGSLLNQYITIELDPSYKEGNSLAGYRNYTVGLVCGKDFDNIKPTTGNHYGASVDNDHGNPPILEIDYIPLAEIPESVSSQAILI